MESEINQCDWWIRYFTKKLNSRLNGKIRHYSIEYYETELLYWLTKKYKIIAEQPAPQGNLP